MKERIIKWIKNLKPVKYMTLLQKYNRLSNDYEVLKSSIANKCFDVIFAQVTTPDVLKEKDHKIEKLKKQLKAAKEVQQ